jgi:amidohydrolase
LALPAGALGAPPVADRPGPDATPTDEAELDAAVAAVAGRVVGWRRDFHAHPELSNREVRTAARVAEHLEALGLEVRTGIAHTGVVGLLVGGRPGPVLALRADMDALPVTEQTDLPFASTVRTTYLDREVGVMHACGHDAHTAILMGVAEVLAGRRERLPGRVLFVFQPAEEGAPPGERGGARLMLEEGVFADPKPDAVIGLHVVPQHPAGEIALVAGGAMAGSDKLEITVSGRQTHAAYPWLGIDPIAVASRIVLAIESLPARQMDVRHPAVVSIGAIHGGVRHNIIPDEVELLGTIRTLEPAEQAALHERIRTTATRIAQSSGASADVRISIGYPVTWNDPELVARLRPALERVPGARVVEGLPRTGAEDFAFLAREAPGLYFWLGIRPPGVAEADAAPNHSPRFFIDESALPLGVRALVEASLEFLSNRGQW